MSDVTVNNYVVYNYSAGSFNSVTTFSYQGNGSVPAISTCNVLHMPVQASGLVQVYQYQ